MGVYGGKPCDAAGLTLLTPEDIGLRLSPGTLVGGVKRLPTLMVAGALEFAEEKEWNFCNCGGGGNSKLGKLEVANRRAVKLPPAPDGSRFEAIPCCTAAAATLNVPSRPCPEGLNTSVSAVGGVGRVLEGEREVVEFEVVAPDQYWPTCAA